MMMRPMIADTIMVVRWVCSDLPVACVKASHECLRKRVYIMKVLLMGKLYDNTLKPGNALHFRH